MDTKHDLKAEFRYWTSPEPPPVAEAASLVNGTHPGIKAYTTEVHDTRTSSKHFNLLDHGFQILKHDSALLQPDGVKFDFSDHEGVRSRYWPELRDLIVSEMGAQVCVSLESMVRESTSDPHVYVQGQTMRLKTNKPFHIVHNDYSPVGSRNLLRAMPPSFYEDNGCAHTVTAAEQNMFFDLRNEILEAEGRAMRESGCASHAEWDGANYDGPRWAHFSIWRPIEPVQRDPLALLDPCSLFNVPSTYKEKGEFYTSIPFPHNGRRGLHDYIGANMMPLYPQAGQKHKWYWTSNQQPNEVYAIKLFDSEAWKEGSRVMPCSAHSAFEIPGTAHLAPRKSIETRCLVVW